MVTCFPAPFTGTCHTPCHIVHVIGLIRALFCPDSMFSALVTTGNTTRVCLNRNALYRFHIFTRSVLGTYFTALVSRYLFSRACYLLHFFPRKFSRCCCPLHVFSRLLSAACLLVHRETCFPAHVFRGSLSATLTFPLIYPLGLVYHGQRQTEFSNIFGLVLFHARENKTEYSLGGFQTRFVTAHCVSLQIVFFSCFLFFIVILFFLFPECRLTSTV